MHDTDDQFFLGRAYFYGVDHDAIALGQILDGVRCGFGESGYRLLFLRATVEARFASFLAAGGGASAGTERLLEAIDVAITGPQDDIGRLDRADVLREQARAELTRAALGPWPAVHPA